MAVHWQDIQKNTFTEWTNYQLRGRGLHVKELSTDLKDGLVLINLLEILSGKSLGRYNKHPRVPTQKYENNQIAIDFIKSENIKIVNIGSTDITDGNIRITLGLIWTLILHYQVAHGGDDNAKNDLLKWVRSKIPEYDIKNFNKDWNDGRALNGLVNALAAGSAPNHRNMDPSKKTENCQEGLDKGFEKLDIPKIISADALSHPRVDEQSVMTYISLFRNAEEAGKGKQNDKEHLASQTSAYGPGLVEGIANEQSNFVVMTPKGAGKLEVKVEGPNDPAKVNIVKKNNPDGTAVYDVSYTPKNPGNYKVHVTLDGIHIPGSIFSVTVLEALSLGGEGKIRVFYSTTSSSAKGRQDVVALQRLLEQKEVHKRSDLNLGLQLMLWKRMIEKQSLRKQERECYLLFMLMISIQVIMILFKI